MYTATLTSKSFNKRTRQYVLVVEFSNGVDTFTEELRFGADFTFDQIKANVKTRIDLLNAGEAGIENISEGAVDISTVPDTTPTKAELDAQEWVRNFNRLEKVQQLIDLGVLTGNETAVTNLRTKVSSDFKPAYINLF